MAEAKSWISVVEAISWIPQAEAISGYQWKKLCLGYTSGESCIPPIHFLEEGRGLVVSGCTQLLTIS